MFQNFKTHYLGLWCLGLGSLGSLGLFVLSLPNVGMGIWFQSEFAVAGLHGFSALCAAGIFIIGLNHKKLAMAAVLHPLVCIPLFIAALSLCLMPFQNLPIRHFLGAPQNGEGVVWWIDWGVLTASALILWRFKLWRWALSAAALLSFLVTAGLTLSHVHFGFRATPYSFPDFLAFNLFCLVPLATGLLQTQSRVIWGGLCALFALALYLTENQIAIAFGVVGIPFFILLGFMFREKESLKIKIGYLTLALLPFIALGCIFALIYIMDGDGFYEFSKIAYFRNILSRGYMMQIGLQPLIENPVMILTGTGWGSFTEHVVHHLPTAWFDFMQEGNDQWEGVSWDQFHTHDVFVDTLFSSGILGLILFFTYFMLIPVCAKSAQKWIAIIFAASLVSVMSFWFLFPINLPFIALAVGAIGKRKSLIQCRQFKILWILPILIILQITAITMHIRTVNATHRYDPQSLSISQMGENCPMEYYDAGAGGLHLARLLVSRIRILTYLAEDEDANPEEINTNLLKLNHLYCQSTQYMKNNSVSNRLYIAQLLVQGEVLLGLDSLDEATTQFYTQNWKLNLEDWLERMPKRTDQAVPFLLWHLVHDKEAEAIKIATLIYTKAPDDPVGLWFTGLSLVARPDTAQKGLSRMRKALKNGIERYILVEDAIKIQLQ